MKKKALLLMAFLILILTDCTGVNENNLSIEVLEKECNLVMYTDANTFSANINKLVEKGYITDFAGLYLEGDVMNVRLVRMDSKSVEVVNLIPYRGELIISDAKYTLSYLEEIADKILKQVEVDYFTSVGVMRSENVVRVEVVKITANTTNNLKEFLEDGSVVLVIESKQEKD